MAWLEEDLSMLQRRLRDECGDGVATGAGDPGLRQLVARLDGELGSERRSRESLEARVGRVEETVSLERSERGVALGAFSSELETTMRGLIARIDEGLSASALAMRERTDATEQRLRTLIQRVDRDLASGAAALQDTLSSTARTVGEGLTSPQAELHTTPAQRSRSPLGRVEETSCAGGALLEALGAGLAQRSRSPLGRVDQGSCAGGALLEALGSGKTSDQLMASWDTMRQDNLKLRGKQQGNSSGASPPGAAGPGPRSPGLRSSGMPFPQGLPSRGAASSASPSGCASPSSLSSGPAGGLSPGLTVGPGGLGAPRLGSVATPSANAPSLRRGCGPTSGSAATAPVTPSSWGQSPGTRPGP